MSSKNTFDDLVEAIRKSPDAFDSVLEELGWYQDYLSKGEELESVDEIFKPFIKDLELIESHGGEGEGESYWKIFSYQGRALRLKGAWISWSGAHFDSSSLDEVEPRQVMTTVYSPIKNFF